MIGAAANSVRLPFQYPSATGRGEISVRFPLSKIESTSFFGPPVVNVIGPHVLLKFFGRIQHWTRFQKGHLNPFGREYVGDGSPTRTRSDNNDFLNFWAFLDLCHSDILKKQELSGIPTAI